MSTPVNHNGKSRRWLRPLVDAAMTVVYLLQMVPGHMGNLLHELAGLAFVVLFVIHHVLNREWLGRLARQQGLRSRLLLVSDIVLTCCVVGVAVTGILMSRSVVPVLSMASIAHVVRLLHGSFAYAGLMTMALHVGLHMRALRGYARRSGASGAQSQRGSLGGRVQFVLLMVCVVVGAWASMRLGVAGKLMGQPSFPDGMTPLPVLIAEHLAFCLPYLLLGALIDGGSGTQRRR